MPKTAIIIGASGLVGSNLLQILLDSTEYTEIRVFVRRDLSLEHPKLYQFILNFDETDMYAAEIRGDVVFSCLGTTRGQVKDQEEYRKIELEYPLHFAEIGLSNGASQFHFISSMGANLQAANSYLKLKGESEDLLVKQKYPAIFIYRPSFLEGIRTQGRLAENVLGPIMKVLNYFMIGKLKKYRSIKAETVARAMYNESLTNKEGTFIYPSNQIQELG